jgi:hypothetical protein
MTPRVRGIEQSYQELLEHAEFREDYGSHRIVYTKCKFQLKRNNEVSVRSLVHSAPKGKNTIVTTTTNLLPL